MDKLQRIAMDRRVQRVDTVDTIATDLTDAEARRRKSCWAAFKQQNLRSSQQPCLKFSCACCAPCSFGIYAIILGGILVGNTAHLKSTTVIYACDEASERNVLTGSAECLCNGLAWCNVTFNVDHVRPARGLRDGRGTEEGMGSVASLRMVFDSEAGGRLLSHPSPSVPQPPLNPPPAPP